MAKKTGQNKAAAIRAYMAKNANDGPKAVADAMQKSGLEVTPAYVSMIKSQDRAKAAGGGKKTSKKKRGRKPKAAAAAPIVARTARGSAYTENSLLSAKKFLESTGSVADAKAALDIVAKLSD